MGGGRLRAKGFLLVAAMAALLFAVGCGSSDSSEVTVESGSLSKAEFIEKADAACEAARTEFLDKYTNLLQAHKSELDSGDKEKKVIDELVNTVLAPNIEGLIEQISTLGAPDAYTSDVASFLEALQVKLEEIQADNSKISASPYPFKKAEDIAKRIGLQGCAESFG